MANRFYCINVSLQYFKTIRTASFFLLQIYMLQENINIPKYLAFLLKTSSLKKVYSVADPREGARGTCAPPPFGFFFFTKTKFTSKISTKQAQNLSQNAGNGHFRDSNFQKFLWEHAPRPP